MKSFPIVILGGGMVAGYAAKEFAAQSGNSGGLAIVTADNALPYERPPLSKGFLAGKKAVADILISDASFYRKHGISILRNFPIKKVDLRGRRLQGPTGKIIEYEQLLIATGSSVRPLKVSGADSSPVFYLRSLRDSEKLKARIKKGKRAVVIGSGFIGMEVASVLASGGMRTTMVLRDDRVWKRFFTPEISQFFERQFASHGVKFAREENIKSLLHSNHGTQIVLESGKVLPADLVVTGIGVTPEVSLFQRTALNTSDGIKVNEYLETNIPGVWAAGDIANYPDRIFGHRRRVEHWDNAVEQGRHVMRNMMGKLQSFIHVPYFFSDEFDLSYEFWGDTEGHDRVVYRGDLKQKQISAWWLKKNKVRAALLMNRPDEERAMAPRWILRGQHLQPGKLQHARSLKSLDATFGAE